MSSLWARETLEKLATPRQDTAPRPLPFVVANVDLSVLEREWVVAPNEPLPNTLLEQIIKSEIPPEMALVKVASLLPATLDLVRPVHTENTLAAEVVDLRVPEIEVKPGQIVEVENVERTMKTWLDRLPLARADYNVGTAVQAGPVTAAEILTAPLKVVSQETFDFSFGEFLTGADGQKIVFDPILWSVNTENDNGTFAAINEICRQSVRLQVSAERVRQIFTYFPRAVIEERMREVGYKGGVVDYLVNTIVNNDPKRLGLRELALRAQLTAARLALLEGMRRHFPSNSLFLIAFCADQWTKGGLDRLLGADAFASVLAEGGWKAAGRGIQKELELVKQQLEHVLFNGTDIITRTTRSR